MKSIKDQIRLTRDSVYVALIRKVDIQLRFNLFNYSDDDNIDFFRYLIIEQTLDHINEKR